MLENLRGKLKWLGIQAVGVAIGVPLGVLLGVGGLLSPRKTFYRKPRSGPISDPIPGLLSERVVVGGTRLHLARTCDNSSSSPGGIKPVLLLLHGFPECWFSWRHQMEALRSEWCVVAMTMRGYGDSDKPQDTASYRMAKLVGDVAGVIAHIAPPGGKVALAGHDWGGNVAWHVAHAHPELLEKLVVLCMPHPSRLQLSGLGFDQLRRLWYIFAFQLPWLPEALLSAGDFAAFDKMFTEGPTGCKRRGAVGQEDIERYKLAFSRPGALTGAINYYRALVDEASRYPDPQMKRCLEKPLTMPVLVLWGEDDAVLRPPLLRGLERHVLRLRVHRLQDCSHWAQQDRADEVTRLLQDFLRLPAPQ